MAIAPVESRFSLFDRMKTKNELTTRAVRHRTIIRILAENTNPSERTRLAISRNIAGMQDSKWQTVYPGVFRDFENSLVPLDLVAEEGRLPMKRGPKALQEQGSPFYALTQKGLVAALAIREIEGRDRIMRKLLGDGEDIHVLAEGNMDLVCYIFRRYVEAWLDGRLELFPLDLAKLATVRDEVLGMQWQMLRSFARWDSGQRGRAMELLESISGLRPRDSGRA